MLICLNQRGDAATRLGMTIILALAIVLGARSTGVAAQTVADEEAGLTSETTYESPQFGFELEWRAPFAFSFVSSDATDHLQLKESEGTTVFVTGEESTSTLADDLIESIAISLANFDNAEVLTEELEAERPFAVLSYEFEGDAYLQYKEIRTYSRDVVLTVAVQVPTTDADELAAMLSQVDASVVLDSASIFDGSPIDTLELDGADGSSSGADRQGDAERETGDGFANSDAPAGDDLTESWESPQYGFSLAYNPIEWQISTEDDDPDDPYDHVELQHELGFVSLTGDPDYTANQLDNCLADYLVGLEQGEDISNVREMRGESGEEDDRAWAAYSFDIDIGGDQQIEAARYVECRMLGDVTAVIIQSSLAENYEAFGPVREELMEGLSPAAE